MLMFGVDVSGVLVFDEDKIADGLALPRSDVLAFFRDGRRGQPIVERRLGHVLAGRGWTVSAVPGGGSRFVDALGKDWELRAITDRLSLAPSKMKGKGRRFDRDEFEKRMDGLGGVLLVDVLGFPRCSFWAVTGGEVREWIRAEVLRGGEIGRELLASSGMLKGMAPS